MLSICLAFLVNPGFKKRVSAAKWYCNVHVRVGSTYSHVVSAAYDSWALVQLQMTLAPKLMLVHAGSQKYVCRTSEICRKLS